MLGTKFLIFLVIQLSTTQGQPHYEAIPFRFDLIINRIQQYQYISAENLNEIRPFNEIPTVLSSIENSSQCDKDFSRIIEESAKGQLWALKVIDAWGKPLPSGLLKGNSFWTGNYDECIQNYYQPLNKSFLIQPVGTQYCAVIPQSSSTVQPSKPQITLGVCVPSSCNRSGVVSILRDILKDKNVTENQLLCSHTQRNLSRGAIATCVILSVLGVIVCIGTVTDIIYTIQLNFINKKTININHQYANIDEETSIEKSFATPSSGSRFSLPTWPNNNRKLPFIVEFSALRTLHRIFNVEKKINDKDSFPFLNGIRVLSLFWVIIGHTIVFSLGFSSNVLDVLSWSHNFGFQLIINAPYSVDTFFLLSGFLTTILFVRQVNKEGKLTFRFMSLYYIHRYIRLTPAFLLVLLISINLTPYFGRGPLYPSQQGFETAGCRNRTWWTSILYISNLVESDDMCLPISWYLYNDMQFFWIAPLALIPFVMRHKPIGFAIAILMTLTGIISIVSILLYYPNMSINSLEAFGAQSGPSFFKEIYIKPWCRISPYAVGILTGFLVINTGRTHRINIYAKCIGTLLAICIGLLCLFVSYPDYAHVPGMSRASLVTFQTLSRTGWAISIAWLILLCSLNQGGFINKILSWTIWTPLARLNYSAYLIHSTILTTSISNQIMPTYFQPHLVVNTFVVYIFFSYMAAIVVHTFLEVPFFILEKKLFKRA